MGCGASVTKESPQGDGFYKVLWIASDQEKQSCTVSATLMPATRIQVCDQCTGDPAISATQSPYIHCVFSIHRLESQTVAHTTGPLAVNPQIVSLECSQSTDRPIPRGDLKLGGAGQGDQAAGQPRGHVQSVRHCGSGGACSSR